MGLRAKTIIMISIAGFILIALLTATAEIVVMGGFKELEYQQVRVDQDRAAGQIDSALGYIAAMVGDWAPWDDSYDFMQTRSAEYVRTNLPDTVLINLRVNFIAFIDASGDLFHAKFVELPSASRHPAPEPDQVSRSLLALPHLAQPQSAADRGILMVQGTPVLLAFQPILRSDHSGPARGCLAMGRYLDAEEVERISEISHLALRVYAWDKIDGTPELQSLKSGLSPGHPVLIHPAGRDSIQGYSLQLDLTGKPAYVLRLESPRQIVRHGRLTLAYQAVGLVCCVVVFLLLVLFFLEKRVIQPVSRLSAAVNAIGMQGTFAQRLKYDGRIAEFETLTERINGMLAQIEEQTEERLKTENQLRKVQKMETIGLLAGGVAHDLNNILAGIVSYPDLLLLQLPPGSPLRKPVLTMQETGKRAAAIVQDLLTLARRGVTVREVLDLNKVIEEYLASPENKKILSFHPRVELESDLAADLSNIKGSPVHITQTIMNLVSNAAEAMPAGGRIRLITGNRHVDRATAEFQNVKPGDYVTLTIADTGSGIAPEDQERIFEPFYTRKIMGRSGTGLGMAVVWGTVKDHDGFIDLHSIPGAGSTFCLYFPANPEAALPKAAACSIDPYRGNGEKILVVDDVAEQRDIACLLLKELGYTVYTAADGARAIEFMTTHTVDLLLLDMIMTGSLDGLDTYRAILERHPRQKAILVSGFAETGRVQAARDLGAGQYLRKPYTLERLAQAVRRELDRSTAPEEAAIPL